MTVNIRPWVQKSLWLLLGLIAGAVAVQYGPWNLVPTEVPPAEVHEYDHDDEHEGEDEHHAEHDSHEVELSQQARENLNLVMRPVSLTTYWRKITIPGEIVDRPGMSDRGVTSPVVGVVTQIHAYPGEMVQPGDRLFTLRPVSEYIQNAQAELFQATREAQLVQEQRERLSRVAQGGVIPQARLIELDQQLRRHQAAIQAHRQDLLSRGLTPEHLAQVEHGNFVESIEVHAPPALPDSRQDGSSSAGERLTVAVDEHRGATDSFEYELQELKIALGAQVQAGQDLAVLANHQRLYVVGHAFKTDAPFLERAAQGNWPLEIEFAEDAAADWPELRQGFTIRHLANSIDPASRTFEFFVPLTNQSRAYEQNEQRFVVWRFRPGQRVRIHVPVEELHEVFVLPAAAVVREGPEAYVFREAEDHLLRVPVHVLHEDRQNVVLANDGSLTPGWQLAQGSAASLQRVLQAQIAAGEPAGVHVHADGTVHEAH
jgi:multidrug efflux pump subunit AcrA (membrane-fusion protein)